MKSLKDYFQECLEKSAENQPVVLVLDSLDQLSIDDGGRQMDWYPRNLPSNVYAVLSTLPGQEYQALPSLRVSYHTLGTSATHTYEAIGDITFHRVKGFYFLNNPVFKKNSLGTTAPVAFLIYIFYVRFFLF